MNTALLEPLVLTIERQMVAVFVHGDSGEETHIGDAPLDDCRELGLLDVALVLLFPGDSDGLDDHIRRALSQLVGHVLADDLNLVLRQSFHRGVLDDDLFDRNGVIKVKTA